MDQPRPSAARRSVSLLVVVALALQVGLGLGQTSTLLRESAGQTSAIRALAEAVVRYVSKPVKEQQERPARVSSSELARLAVRVESQPVVNGHAQPRMLLVGLIALPPPVA
ncbi:MAG: hypothetical protein JNM86_12610 [Phycisphaerae bacterium]|nr:hypothetical protein [Phycisphaerae bacterium]